MAAKVETGELLALICKAARERYHEDITAPGVQVAHVTEPDGNFWYVALHRYVNAQSNYSGKVAGHSRSVEFKTQDADLDAALYMLAATLVPATGAQQELAKALK